MRIHLLIGPTAESSDRFRTILKKKNALLAKSGILCPDWNHIRLYMACGNRSYRHLLFLFSHYLIVGQTPLGAGLSNSLSKFFILFVYINVNIIFYTHLETVFLTRIWRPNAIFKAF